MSSLKYYILGIVFFLLKCGYLSLLPCGGGRGGSGSHWNLVLFPEKGKGLGTLVPILGLQAQ